MDHQIMSQFLESGEMNPAEPGYTQREVLLEVRSKDLLVNHAQIKTSLTPRLRVPQTQAVETGVLARAEYLQDILQHALKS